jgi:hypothetical protein
MAAVKELVFEAIELAAACEEGHTNRFEALAAWVEFRLKMVDRYGEGINAWLVDIYDSIADRYGEYWELYLESN